MLQRSLQEMTLAHAYLLVGPQHVGKMTLAMDLVKAINCEAPEPPCGECNSCQKIALIRHADVQIIGLSTAEDSTGSKPHDEISIEQIRQLQHSISLPPFEGRYRSFIINGVESLSNEAANCLLKTLEEPPSKVLFLLLTTNEKLVPTTVISRCHRLELLPLASAEMEAALQKQWGIELEKAKLLSRLSHGCLGWALSAAFSDDLIKSRNERLEKIFDITMGDIEECFTFAAQLTELFNRNKSSVYEILDLWIRWWRDLLLVKVNCVDIITNIDFTTKFTERIGDYSLVQIRDFIDSIQEAVKQLKQNANPRLVLEVLMLDLPERKEIFSLAYG